MADQLLKIRGLKTIFLSDEGVAVAVDNVSLELRQGETLGLVGESGCGKSVTALSIMRLVQHPGRIVSGEIFFEGVDLLRLEESQMREIRGDDISMIFQEPMTSLNPVFTIGDQIGEAILVHENVDQEELRQGCIQLLRDVGIPSPEQRLKDYPHQLSGGQRQRVMIAMALACNPDLVIADEPTTALDVTIQAQILSLFRELKKKRGMSLLYITHDLGVVSKIADRIYVMYAGVIAEHGKANHILREPRHPYTQALLASLPSRMKRGQTLHTIPGTVPNPAYKPAGCPFHPRCPHAIDSCRTQYPALCDYGEGHLSRCPVLFQREKPSDGKEPSATSCPSQS